MTEHAFELIGTSVLAVDCADPNFPTVTARGRLGWAFNTLLAYATGGLAVTRLGTSNSYSDNVSNAIGT